MSAKQYRILSDLYHEWHDEFRRLSYETQAAFHGVLSGRLKFNRDTGRYE